MMNGETRISLYLLCNELLEPTTTQVRDDGRVNLLLLVLVDSQNDSLILCYPVLCSQKEDVMLNKDNGHMKA